MNSEPLQLLNARKHLISAEKKLLDEAGIYHLSEGFTLLEEVIDGDFETKYKEVAQNIGNTYVSKIYSDITRLIQDPKSATEPNLEHIFKLLIDIEDFEFGDVMQISELKVRTVNALLKEYLRGHSEEEKKNILKGKDVLKKL